MIRSSLFLILFFSISIVFGQDTKAARYAKDLEMANTAFNQKRYNTACGFYQKAYSKINEPELKQKVLFNIAESYRKSNNFKQAIKWFEQVVNSKYPDPAVLLSYGQLLKNFEKYEDAIRVFYDYSFEVPGDKRAQKEMDACKQAIEWKLNPEKFNVLNLKELNTKFSDYSPFYSSGKIIWASSRKEAKGNEIFEWTGQKCSDYFESSINGNSFGKIQSLSGKVNTNFNDGVAWIDTAGSTMYYTQCNGSDGKGLNCKIYVSFKNNESWTDGKLLPFNSDSFSCGHPALSYDNKKLFFASDMPGGFGEKDLYSVNYDYLTDKWGTPVNLGSNVNTTEDDMFPFVDENGTLFFSSKGHKGMGGLDIFRTYDSAGTYRQPQNLKFPVNSGGDDFGISFIPKRERKNDNLIAYFSSNREGGIGDDDLYSISIKPFFYLVKGRVLESESMQPLPAAKVLVKQLDGKVISNIKANDKGEFTADVPINILAGLQGSRENYFSTDFMRFDTRNLEKDTTIEITLILTPIPAKEVEIVLQGIFYDLNKWDLRAESKRVLDSLVLILKNNPSIVIEIGSHTDSRAGMEYNLDLSNKRAKVCVDYLVEHGIDKNRLVAIGYGESKLVNDCSDGVNCTEEEHQQNRRTTFRVLKSDFKSR